MDPELKDCRVFERVVKAACAPPYGTMPGTYLRNSERRRLDDVFGVLFLAAKTDDEEAQAWFRAFDGGKLSRERGAHWIRSLPFGGAAVPREDKG